MVLPVKDFLKLHSNEGDGLVELYTADATALGGSLYRFAPYYHPDGYLSFGGTHYTCFPVASAGWEFTASGTAPRPTLQVSNVTQSFLYGIINIDDLVGMEIQRFFTKVKYLDDGSSPDSSKRTPSEIYYVEQKTQHDARTVTWQLSSPIDRANLVLPRRQYLKDPTTGNVYAPGLGRYSGAA